jgi:hypothetical protein
MQGLAAVATVAAVSSRKGRPALPPSDGITAPVDSQSKVQGTDEGAVNSRGRKREGKGERGSE